MGFDPIVACQGIVDMLGIKMLATQTIIQLDHRRNR